MKLNKIFLQKSAVIIILVLAVFMSGMSVAQKFGLGTVNPAVAETPQTAISTYEQQSINAVRAVKPAVVDIVGNSSVQNGDITTIGGTGFIIDSNGLIVSNGHVVQDSSIKYSVVFADGTQYDAKVLGLDKLDDVALLKIDATGLPTAKLGNSDNLETGQTVFAIGNTLGKYQNTITKGVVSGLGRAVDVSQDATSVLPTQPRMQNLIQTDAAINPGNSGGPLINLSGEVIGMNTLIDTGGEGLGFSIPVNMVKNIVDQLQKFGKVSKPYVGVSFVTIDKAVQAIKGLPVSDGAYVDSVITGGPAAKAGIKAGDIITKINNEKLTTANELDNVVNRYQSGNQVTVTLLRNGEQIELPLILGQYQQ